MKKLLLCGGFAGLAVLLVFVLRVVPRDAGQLAAQEGRSYSSQQTQPQPSYGERSTVLNQPSRFDPPATSNAFGDSLVTQWGVSSGQSELQKLRNEHTQIAQGKAALMTLEELKEAVAVTRTDFSELKAEKELAALVGNLGKLIEKYPQSKAASEARKLLGKPDPNTELDTEDFGDEGGSEDAGDSAE